MNFVRQPIRIVFWLSLGVCACTGATVNLDGEPHSVISGAKSRLIERNIILDPSGEGPHRLRTAFFCHKELDPSKGGWDRSFTIQRPGPVGFSYVGSVADQDAKKKECSAIHRVLLEVKAAKGGSVARVDSQWWRLEPGKCKQDGDPLTGILDCVYRYVPAVPTDDVRPFILGILRGL